MKEDWLDHIVNNLDKLPQAEPDQGFVQNLLDKVDQLEVPSEKIRTLSPRYTWLAAASIAAIVTGNILLMTSQESGSASPTATSEYEQISDEYGLTEDDNPFNLSYDE